MAGQVTETPLITAAYGDADVARALIEAGADVEARATEEAGGVPGGTALLHAAVFGMTPVVDVLIAAGARSTASRRRRPPATSQAGSTIGRRPTRPSAHWSWRPTISASTSSIG